MKNYIFSLVCLCCTLLPALEGQAHEYPNHPELRKSDANIVGHILDKNTKEHLSYITVALKGTTIGTVTDATGHYFLKNLPEGNFVLEVSSVGYKTVRRNVTLKKGRTLEEDFEIEEDAVALDGVVVSANRNETTRRLAPTLVNVVEYGRYCCCLFSHLCSLGFHLFFYRCGLERLFAFPSRSAPVYGCRDYTSGNLLFAGRTNYKEKLGKTFRR